MFLKYGVMCSVYIVEQRIDIGEELDTFLPLVLVNLTRITTLI